MARMTVGEKIQYLLDQKEMSQKEFAKILNIAPTTLSGYIRNKREPDFLTLKKIALSLHTSVDYLIGIPPSLHPVEGLYPSELELIKHFRNLDENQQELILEVTRILTRQNLDLLKSILKLEYQEEKECTPVLTR